MKHPSMSLAGRYYVCDIILRITGLVTSVILAFAGSYCIKECDAYTMRDYVSSSLVFVGGICMVISESSHWLKKISCLKNLIVKILFVLYHRTGRAFCYLIIGGLTLSEIRWMQIVGIFTIALGILNLIAAIWIFTRNKKETTKELPKSEIEDPNASLTSNAV